MNSPTRERAILVYNKMYLRASKYIKHATIKKFVDKLIHPHIIKLVTYTIPETEIKQIMTELFYDIKPIVEDYQVAENLKEAKKLNSPEMTRSLMKLPDFTELAELLEWAAV